MLKVEGLRAGYQRIEVVHGIDLQVGPGEVVALLGPNGAGKTTTLKTAAGHLKALGGQISWNGDTRTRSPHRLARAGLTLVAERSVLHSLSTADNLSLGRGTTTKALDLFPELRLLMRRRAGLLSGGEQQMLALARALAGDPRVLLLDEVSAGLAPVIVDRLFMAARRASHETGVGILLVEQQVRRALSVADRGYVLHRGKVVLSGTASELVDEFRSGRADYFT